MKEEKHGFIHNLLFNLITKRYYKKKEPFKGPKSLKNTVITTTILEKNIKKRYKRPDWWGVTKAIVLLGLVFYVGFTIWQTLSSALEVGMPQSWNGNLSSQEKANLYNNETGWIIQDGNSDTQKISSGEQTSIAPKGFIEGFFSILAVLTIIGFLITLVRVVASPLGGEL